MIRVNHAPMVLPAWVTKMNAEAAEAEMTTGQIRRAIWERQGGTCVRCPTIITWKSLHMHERVHRGRGGEISLENSEGLCYECHLGVRGVHPEKQLNFRKRKDRA